MSNEPVAWLSNDSFEISTMQSDKFSIPLYTSPSEHDLGVAEAIGFDKGYKAATAKTLTDEEIDLVVGVLASCVCTIKTEIDQEKQTFKGYEHCSNLPSLESELKDSEKAVVTLKKIQGK